MNDTWSTPTQSLPDGTPNWPIPPPSFPPQQRPPLWRRPWVVITGCTVLGLAALGIIGAVTEVPVADVQQPQPTVTAPNTTPVTKAPLAVPQSTEPTVTSPPPTTVSQRAQVQAWWAKAEDDATALEEHSGEIGRMFTDDPYSVMLDPTDANILLIHLQADVRRLKAHGPIPIPEVNRPWQKALSAYGKAYDLVYDGINEGDYEKVIEGAELMNEGNTYMGEATEELTRFNVA